MSGNVLVQHSGASHLCWTFMGCHTYSWRDFGTLLHRTRGILDIKFFRIILGSSTISDNLWVLFVLFLPTPNKCLTWVRWTKAVTDLVSYLRILNVVSPAIPESLSVLFFYTIYVYISCNCMRFGVSLCHVCLQCLGRQWSLSTVGIWVFDVLVIL